jgi:hypothetical protein
VENQSLASPLPQQSDMNYPIWTPSGTDITIRWRQAGWVPPTETIKYLAKWAYYQNLPLRSLSDHGKLEYEAQLRAAKVNRIHAVQIESAASCSNIPQKAV